MHPVLLVAALAIRAALPDPQLESAVADAIALAPEVRAAAASSDAAEQRIAPAGTLPDPTASINWDGDRRMAGITASQALPWPGKRALASRVALADAAARRASAARATLSIEARVRNAWYELELARALDSLVDDRRATAQQIEQIARARYASGLTPQQDVIRAQIEIARLAEETNSQRAAIAARRGELLRLVGHEVDVDTVPFSESIPSTDALIAAAAERSPELAAARVGVTAAQTRVELARKNLRPDFVVSAGPMLGTMDGSLRTAISFGAGVSLPIHAAQRQRSELAEAESLVRVREEEAAAIERDLAITTAARAASLEAATKTAELYRDKLIPLDDIALRSAIAGYQSGKIPFIALLEAVHAVHDDHFAYLARVAECAKWRAAIDEATPSSEIATPSSGARRQSQESAGIPAM